MHLPAYAPPSPQRAAVAASGAPIVVLAAFVGVVTRLMQADTAFAACLAATLWVCWEMHQYQRAVDGYNAAFVRHHLRGRAPEALAAWAQAEGTPESTRAFVHDYLASGCRLRRDGPRLEP